MQVPAEIVVVPNLVSGMKWLLGGFSQAWNRHYKRKGHVFQARYISIPVPGERAADSYHCRIVADYIHLNCLHSVHAAPEVIFSSENDVHEWLAKAS